MAFSQITRKLLIAALFAAACITAQAQGIFIYSSYSMTPQAATPTFSPVAGAVSNPTTVTASTSTSGCGSYIYFDTSSTPTTNQTTYSVTTAVTLYAYVHGCPGYTDSAVSAPQSYTISAGGPSPVSGTGTVCQISTGVALAYTYTPHATGDGMVFVFGKADPARHISSVADNGASGGSSYTVVTQQSGTTRTGQLIYTTSFHSGVTTITFTPSSTLGGDFAICGQEFSNMTAFANTGGVTFTGGAYTGTTLTCTLANSTDYLFLGGTASGSATGFSSGPNGTLVGPNTSAGFLTWAQYVLNAQGTGTLNYTTGSVNLMCGDVQ